MHPSLLPTQFLLYGDDGYDSHTVRFLLEEKGLDYQFIAKDGADDDLAHLNPYKTLPILVGKDISLYEINIIFEYLEERHQMPKLLPATPKDRAMARTLAWRIQKDWLTLGRILLTHPDSFDEAQARHAKKTLSDTLTTIAPLFAQKPYFLSDNFGFCDVLLVPFLYRLPMMGIDLSVHLCRPLVEYVHRMTARPSFQNTLTTPTLTKENFDDYDFD